MKFSWKALLSAPLLAPLLAGGVSLITPDKDCGPLCTFEVVTVFSYGFTLLLGLPGFFLISKVAPLTFLRTCAVGAMLGVMSYVLLEVLLLKLIMPHPVSFAEMFADYISMLAVVKGSVFGLVTAAAYWFLAGGKISHQPARAL